MKPRRGGSNDGSHAMPKLDTDYGSFKELVSAAKVYTVPLYQRRYSWTAATQVAELWGDVVRLYRERVTNGVIASTHFIGSVVVGETESKALGPGACSIIDGQQRLTTLSLILAAIRDTLVTDESDRMEISTNYLTFPGSNGLRLQLSQEDSDVYSSIVYGQEVIDKKSPVYKAYAYIQRKLDEGFVDDSDPDEAEPDDLPTDLGEPSNVAASETDGDDDTENIEIGGETTNAPAALWNWELLLQVISADLELVSISGVPAERAYQIFATLNHGGLKLSQVDLIRNAVFMKLPTRNKEAHKKIWKPLEAELGERSLGRALHAWVVRRGHNVPQKDTYASVLQELKVPTEHGVFDLLEELQKDTPVFVLINDALSYEASKIAKDWGVPDELFRSLKFLTGWGNVPAQPLLMEIVARWRSKDLTGAKATKLVRAVESLLVRRFIAQVPPNDLRSTLARLTTQVVDANKQDFEAKVVTAMKEPTRRWPADIDVQDSMVTKPLYRPKNTRQTFLVLRRLAEELEGKESPQIESGTSSTKYTIEHVLPQTVEGTNWLSKMAEWGDTDPHQAWHTRRHTAGNLTLTAYNSELSNKSFAEKKVWIQEKLKLKLSTQILDEDIWTKNEIESRSEALAELANKIWIGPS